MIIAGRAPVTVVGSSSFEGRCEVLSSADDIDERSWQREILLFGIVLCKSCAAGERFMGASLHLFCPIAWLEWLDQKCLDYTIYL